MAGVKTDGTLWAWGYGAQGQLGQGDTNPRSSPTQVGTQTYWKTTKYGFGGGKEFHFLLTST
jgi:alpha-tubulin suppressor-like RCC1 family protein